MTEKEIRASKVYQKTRGLANANAVVQGLSGIIGLGANLLIDVAAIPFYANLWNDIRDIYGKGHITAEAVNAYVRPNLNFLVQDFIWDKVVGSIPIVGIPFNVAFAKALTWRLGAWFGLLSAIGEESTSDSVLLRSTMQLTREIFPLVGSVFSFETPDEHKFITFIAAQDGLTYLEAQERTRRALELLSGECNG